VNPEINESALINRIVEAVKQTQNEAYEKALNAHLKVVLDRVKEDHERLCPFTVEDVSSHVPHIKGIIRDLGNGHEDVGLRRLRAIFTWADEWQDRNEDLRTAVTWCSEVKENIKRYKVVIGGVIVVTLLNGLGQIIAAGYRIVVMTNGGG
jgi:hypothetical protein